MGPERSESGVEGSTHVDQDVKEAHVVERRLSSALNASEMEKLLEIQKKEADSEETNKKNGMALAIVQEFKRSAAIGKMKNVLNRRKQDAHMAKCMAKGKLGENGELLESKLDGHDAVFSRKKTSARGFDKTDCTFVRVPNLASLLDSRTFHLYKHRYTNSQYGRTLHYPTLPQPKDQGGTGDILDAQGNVVTCCEISKSRSNGHRFIIAADTQFGILMDGFAMEEPNWDAEIELSRRAVERINSLEGPERPLFVCVCGDLVDTESSFSTSMASWKKVMNAWERHVVFEQQIKDWKSVWSKLHSDIALVCLCGNHDVGNRPTPKSIDSWKTAFGDDYLAFWVNGTYNIGLNNNLFNEPSGAMERFEEQLAWLQERLEYANENKATYIFVYSHFPWFLIREDETDGEIMSASAPPEGWGPEGAAFPDNYFTIPIETRQLALDLFKKHNVTACFSGHFHQNVEAKTSWGMDMIITGPLSMSLTSSIQSKLSTDVQDNGYRVVDVTNEGFSHKFLPLNTL